MSLPYLDSAFSASASMYSHCKAAVGSNPGSMLTGPIGLDLQQSKILQAREQYRHNKNWVWVAVRAIAQRIAGQDLFVGKLQGKPTGKKLYLPNHLRSIGDKLAPIENHELLESLDSPNPIMVRWSLMFSTVGSMLLTGRGYWWVIDAGDKLEIWPLPSHWLEPSDPLRGSWKLRPFGGMEEHELEAKSVIPFILPDPANPFGSISPLQSQAAAVSTDEEIQLAQYRAFQNGVNPGLMIRVGRLAGAMPGQPGERPVLTQAQRNEITAAILKMHGGTSNRNNPLIVDGMIEGVEKLTTSPQEMDFLNSGNQTKARILQAFGVNPITVGEIEGANRASAVVAEQGFVETVNPLIELMSQSLTRWAKAWYAEKLVVWIDPCRVHDPEQKLNEWKAARANGDVSTNEFRRQVLNLEDVPGGDVRRDSLGNPIEPAKYPARQALNGHARA